MRSDIPSTRFVLAPDGVRIAYQVVGSGQVDVVLVTDWASSIDLMWEIPQVERFLRRLAGVGRLILFDKRGNGASDRLLLEQGQFGAAVEQAAGDLLTVLDAAESDRAGVVGSTFGGWPALLFAATHPGRCSRLVLQDCAPRLVRGDDFPQGLPQPAVDAAVGSIRKDWGRGVGLVGGAPALVADEDLRRAFGRYERLAVDRVYMANGWAQMAAIDMRAVLPLIRAQTLVIAHPDAEPISLGGAAAALTAERIPDATFVPLDGTTTLYWADVPRAPDRPRRRRAARNLRRAGPRGALCGGDLRRAACARTRSPCRSPRRGGRVAWRQGPRNRCSHRRAGDGSRTRGRGRRLTDGEGPDGRLRAEVHRSGDAPSQGRRRAVGGLRPLPEHVEAFVRSTTRTTTVADAYAKSSGGP